MRNRKGLYLIQPHLESRRCLSVSDGNACGAHRGKSKGQGRCGKGCGNAETSGVLLKEADNGEQLQRLYIKENAGFTVTEEIEIHPVLRMGNQGKGEMSVWLRFKISRHVLKLFPYICIVFI